MRSGPRLAVLAVSAVCFAASACGSDHPPVGAIVGAACRGDFDCGGLYCVDPGGGTCEVPCRSNVDCGPGFSCETENRHGAGGKVDVCMPN